MVNLGELVSFFTSLAEKPELARRFKENPRAVIEEAPLSPETKTLLTYERQDFMSEVFAEARPRVTVKTSVQTHVSTNTNNHVTTTVLVVVL